MDRLTAPGVVLAHNISYPYDDMVVGSWVSDIAADETTIVDDVEGFHDPPDHGWRTFPLTYDTVAVHHIQPEEMFALRDLPQFRDEWDHEEIIL